MEVPKLGVESELQLLATATATAQSDSEACALALLSDPLSLPPLSVPEKDFFFNGGERSLWKWRHFTYWVRFIIVHHS